MERTLTAVQGTPTADPLPKLLSSRRSQNTRRACQKDFLDFFRRIPGSISRLGGAFLRLSGSETISLVAHYKANLPAWGLAEAPVNRWLAARRSLVTFAQSLGMFGWRLDSQDISNERVRPP